jgi:hypothetical protein
MDLRNRRKWLLEVARKLAVRRARERQAVVAPHAIASPGTPPDVEELLRLEQHEVARFVEDAMALLAAGASESSKAALRRRMENLSPSARITARVLTKLRLNGR